MKKIAWFTEGGFRGKVHRQTPNMKTPLDWIAVMEADHFNLGDNLNEGNYDLGIMVIPKENPQRANINNIKKFCTKVAIMQEGPFWLFQDYSLEKQISYFNNLTQADIIFVHNEQDKRYYKGLTNHKDVRILPSVMIEDPIKNIIKPSERSGIMIGGNMVSWYGGFDSFILASSVTDEIYSPSMGRRQEGEPELGISQLPYMQWDQWIIELSKRKIGIHMMRTHAAGTFAMNCSYLGIPCIGYKGLDTQRNLHPNLSVDDGDMESAKKLVNKLWNNLDFYKENCILTKKLFEKEHSEEAFKKKIK
tara:strand:- start:2136 stop:3050 length:915 start_codon:yes stop_codon:yes gene_type:complete